MSSLTGLKSEKFDKLNINGINLQDKLNQIDNSFKNINKKKKKALSDNTQILGNFGGLASGTLS